MKWTKDPQAEGKMKQLGIAWTVCTEGVPTADINMELSLHNQARIGKKVNDDWVLEMAQAAQDGSEFPMPVYQKMKGGHFIWSGIHRTNMATLIGELKVPCYLVNIVDDRMRDIFPRVINTVHGHGESREHVLEHAKYLVEKHGLDTSEVAKMCGLKTEWLWQAVRSGAVANTLNGLGIKGADFPKSILIWMSPLTANSNVLKATAKLLRDEDLAGDRAKQVIDDVKKFSTERQQLDEVSRWKKIMDDRKPKASSAGGNKAPPLTRGNRSKLIDHLTRLEKFLTGITKASQLQLDDADAKIVIASWDKVERKMNALMTEGAAK